MRVLQLIGMGVPKFGGFEKYILELARQLSARGDSMLVVFSRQPQNKDYIDSLEKVGNIEWTVLVPASPLKYIGRLSKIAREFRPDIMHTNFARDGLLGLAAGKLMGIKTVRTAHCMPSGRGIKAWLSHRLRSGLSDRSLVVSNRMEKELESLYGIKKTRTLYLGVPDFSFDKEECRSKCFPGVPADKVIITCVAFHDPVKGIDLFLQALVLLKPEFGAGKSKAALVGGGNNTGYRTYLHDLATELGLDDDVIWMGIRNDVPEILSASDIYCQPSRSEAISLSIMEASVAGLPTVAFDVGGVSEIAREGVNGFLAEPLDVNGLAEKLSILVKDPILREKMGEKAKAIAAENFRLQEQAAKLIDIYDSLLLRPVTCGRV